MVEFERVSLVHFSSGPQMVEFERLHSGKYYQSKVLRWEFGITRAL